MPYFVIASPSSKAGTGGRQLGISLLCLLTFYLLANPAPHFLQC